MKLKFKDLPMYALFFNEPGVVYKKITEKHAQPLKRPIGPSYVILPSTEVEVLEPLPVIL